MFLLVISVIHTNNILKIQKGLLSGKSTLLRYVCLIRNDAGVTNIKHTWLPNTDDRWLGMKRIEMTEGYHLYWEASQQCPWHFISFYQYGNAVQRSETSIEIEAEMPRVNCIKTYSDGVQLGLLYSKHL